MTCLPSSLTAGDSWSIEIGATDYPAPPWSLALVLTPEAGGAPVTLPGSFAAGAWSVTAAASVTAAIAAGRYVAAVLASDAGADARAVLVRATLTVDPDPALGGDLRSLAEKHLAAIDALLADPSWLGAESYTIEGRSLARRSLSELNMLRARYAAEVRRARGQSAFSTIKHRLAP